MARVTAGILCDFAQVRAGMLFVSSGGVTRRMVPQVPSRLGVMLAMMVEVPATEQADSHELVVAVKKADTAEQVVRAVSGVKVRSSGTFPGESVYVPAVADLRQLRAPAYGPYDVSMSVDDNLGPHLTLYIVKPPSKRSPR